MSRALAITALATAACVSPDDYGDPVAANHGVDAAPSPGCSLLIEHDEDGDCLNDKDDMCPMLPGAPQVDSDHDFVGDDCDPQHDAHNGGNFYGFGKDQAAWISDGDAHWQVSDDTLQVDLLDARSGGASQFGLGNGPILVVAQIRVQAVGPEAEISLFASYSAKYGSGSECWVRLASPQQAGELGASSVHYPGRDLFQTERVPVASDPLEVGKTFRLRAVRGYTVGPDTFLGHSCTYVPLGTPGTEVRRDEARGTIGTELRLAARDVRLVVEWMAAYRIDANRPLQPTTVY